MRLAVISSRSSPMSRDDCVTVSSSVRSPSSPRAASVVRARSTTLR
jgi:hypothetical protein